jgi:hypothetical protein
MRVVKTHRNLLEVVTQLDNRSTAEFSRLVHRQHTVLETVQLRLDQEQVAANRQPSAWVFRNNAVVHLRARLDGQES